MIVAYDNFDRTEADMSFLDKLQDTIDQGLKNSKDLLGKAKDKAKDLGEIGVIRFEIKQLESQAEKLIAKLGTKVYEVIVMEEQKSVSASTAGVKEILSAIAGVRTDIEAKEEQLKTFE
jgi:hypothetical protein